MFYTECLPKSPTSAAAARRLLDRFADEVDLEVLEDARLLISEVVTNAVEHVREDGEIEVRAQLEDGVLRVEVLDPGPGFTPRPRHANSSQESGWGLHFTALLAVRWGSDRADRARVWFELEGRAVP
jgi:anti-sigma regulatory factor (Ser/Thr protein kinase)